MLGVGFKARLATLQEAMLWAKINRAWSGPERYASNDMQGVARSFPTSTWETRYDHTIRCWRSATVSGPRGPLHCDIASFSMDEIIPLRVLWSGFRSQAYLDSLGYPGTVEEINRAENKPNW
jgi:hypothetical protein